MTSTLPELAASSKPPAQANFRNEDDTNASQTATGLTVEETVLLARRSDLAALRAASLLAYVED
jgi:hypothetical protein